MSITILTGRSQQTVADVMSAPAITVRDTYVGAVGPVAGVRGRWL
jgi:hypothetical protein